MQVQALKSQVEHLKNENASLKQDLASNQAAHLTDMDVVRAELTNLQEYSNEVELEKESLKEDIDGWRTRCQDLEKSLYIERNKYEDERKEGILLREKVRKLGDKLALSQSAAPGDGSSPTEDQQLAVAQAKLIAEMRDQIFSLAAALERERLRNSGTRGDDANATSPLLKALTAQDGSDSPASTAASSVTPTPASSSPRQDRKETTQAYSGKFRHNESATNSTASSYQSSSFSSSGLGNITEDTSATDDESVFGSKSPISPAFSSNMNNGGISIHSMSTPLSRVDSNFHLGSGLQTLTEEDEEEAEDMYEEEEEDRVPELIPDELRSRTQSSCTSTGSSAATDDHMPLTPIKELPSAGQADPSSQASNHKPTHERSDSFIKQWSFPKGAVERSSSDEARDSFWNIYSEPLPALPVAPAALDVPPFSAEISLDEDYFSTAFAKHNNRPPSLHLNQGGPPPSRSSIQAQILSADASSAGAHQPELTPPNSAASTFSSVGSRISLQGFSSLWGSYMKSSPSPVATHNTVSAEKQQQALRQQLESASPLSSTSSLSAPPPVPPKQQLAAKTGDSPRVLSAYSSRRLLKLEPSPLSRLDFTHSCGVCEASGSRVITL